VSQVLADESLLHDNNHNIETFSFSIANQLARYVWLRSLHAFQVNASREVGVQRMYISEQGTKEAMHHVFDAQARQQRE